MKKTKKHNIKKFDRKDIMELLLAVANAAHLEYHIVELFVSNKDNKTKAEILNKLIKEARDLRVELMNKVIEKHEIAGVFWCEIKHALLLLFHLFELAEKERNGNYYVRLASKVLLMIDDILLINPDISWNNCPRCEEDKKIEEER